jgi:tetratricopeptide (TPR) repeat protein
MAKNATVPQAAALLEQVRALDKSLPALWRDGRLLAALGEAYGELGDFESAIDRYKQAIRDEGAEAPIKTVEQLANLLSRHAAALRDTKRNPRRFIREATEWLDWVARLGETSERLALHGSTFKRLARAASAEQRRQMLRKACFYYGKAHEAALREDGAIDPYPALNWATYRFLLGDKNPKELLDLIGKCRAVPPRPGQSERDFWYRVRQPDAALLEHLVQGNLPANVNTMVKQYRQVVADGASQRQIASVRDQIAFLAEMLRGRASAGVLQALEKIQQAI